MTKLAAVASGVLLLAGCAGNGGLTTGAIPGANTGTVIGSPIATGAGEPQIGAIEGGLMGADIGRSLNAADRAVAQKAEYEALEYGRAGQPTIWQSPSDDTHGRIKVGPTYQVNRLDCREYSHDVWIGGRLRTVSGTACRTPDGSWRVIS